MTLPRVGLATWAGPDDPVQGRMIDRVMAGLQRAGLVDGVDMQCRRAFGMREPATMAAAAAALARWQPQVIVSLMTNADLAVLSATAHLGTPIVCWSMEPVDSGLVPSARHPGGRLTGVSFPPGLAWLQLRALKTACPALRRIGYLHHPGYAPAPGALAKARAAAVMFGLELEARTVDAWADVAGAITALRDGGALALLVGPHELFNLHGAEIGRIALAQGLACVGTESMVQGGALLGYVPDFDHIWDCAGALAARVLAGAAPAGLPIARHIAPRLVLNLGSAEQLGWALPASFIDEAHTVLS
jgi:putative tryptophan/tyrosine transport system substrate-binding protein